jgi:hypothetical protein
MNDLAAKLRRADFLFHPLDVEILGEQASSLGHHGRLVEKAMAALVAFDAAGGDEAGRRALVRAAAKEVWAFFVQRELCGMRDHREVIRLYGIPPEVLVRLGAVERD